MRPFIAALALLLILTGSAPANPEPGTVCSPSSTSNPASLASNAPSSADSTLSSKGDPKPLLADGTAPKADPNRPIHDKWALIIGISKFKDSSLNLKYPAKDAKDFADFLTREANFAPDHIKLLLDEKASRENILDYMGDKWLPRVAAPDDLVLIYFSSHGSPSALDLGGVNYVVAHDTDKNRLYSTGLAMQDLARIIKGRVHSDRILILLDACHSGAVTVAGEKGMTRTGNISAEDVAQGTGQMVICSSDTSEVSWESKRYENSVFTHCLIESMKKNGKQTKLGEAFTQLKEDVETEVRRDRGAQQMPVIKGQWQGDELMVALPPSHPGPGLDVGDEASISTTSSTTEGQQIATASGAAVTTTVPTTTATVPPTTNNSDTGQKGQSSSAIPDHALVAVMKFGGPGEVKCKGGGLFTALRSKGFKSPTESDFDGLSEALRQTLADKLKEKLGGNVFGPKELQNISGAAFYTQKVNADYQLEGAIHKVQYDAGDLIGNKWEMTFSASMIDSSTRKCLFSIGERTTSGYLKTSSDPTVQMYTDVMAKIADLILEKALPKLQSGKTK